MHAKKHTTHCASIVVAVMRQLRLPWVKLGLHSYRTGKWCVGAFNVHCNALGDTFLPKLV